MARFTLPRDLYYGDHAIDELKNLKGYKKAIIVTGGSSMKRGGFLQQTEDALHAAGMETMLFEGVEPDLQSKPYSRRQGDAGVWSGCYRCHWRRFAD